MSTTEQEDEYSAAFDAFAAGDANDEAKQEAEAESDAVTEQPENDESNQEQPKEKQESIDSDDEDKPSEGGQTDAPKSLEEELEYYKHGFETNRGRVSAYQKKINELETKLKEKSNHADSAKDGNDADPGSNPEGSGMSDEQWNEFAEDYPELASALEKRLADFDQALNARLGEIEHKVTPLEEKAHEEYVNSQLAVLETKHPDWQQVTSSEEFSKWITEQPEAVRELGNSLDAHDASFLIETFKSMTNAQSNSSSQKRQERLRQSVNISSKGGGRQTGIPDDYDAAFDLFASQSNK